MASSYCVSQLPSSHSTSSAHGWAVEIDSDEDADASVNFLPGRSNSTTAAESYKRTRAPSMFQVVMDAMRVGKRNSTVSQSDSVTGTPSSVKREMKSPSSKRKLWAISRHKLSDVSVQKEEAQNGPIICPISDGPTYLFRMASKGNVKQISAVCNAQPERLLSRDPKGASVLHHAAALGRTSVMDYVLAEQNGGELLNSTDEIDATPLHWAVTADNGDSVEYLMSRGADPTLQNNAGEVALHTAVAKNSLDALRTLIKHKGIVNLNIRQGNSGVTPLHVAASLNHADAAKILMDAGAKPCLPCCQGYRPLHTAALNGSRGVMKVILDKCVDMGYTRSQVLSFNDNELCSPLHCAVLGGNPDAIKMCLNYGAKLDTQQADLTTPMHLVCAQGAFDIVQNMFSMAREQAVGTLSMQDKQKHTPLHKAAMYGHANIVKYLVEEGADADMLDTELNSPLLLAASRGNWVCVRNLIELRANFLLKNKDDRNFMHMIVLNGGDIRKLDLDEITDFTGSATCKAMLCRPEVHQLLNQADSAGCTPLHYACQEGNLASLETLMMLGVSARLKSAGNQSPLHFGARYGRYNACRRLLDSEQGPNIINEKDDKGMTPLHFAAQNGHSKVVQLLLKKGAAFHRNTDGESVLHVAASNGYTRTIRTLVDMNRTLLDQTDDLGNTPLHHAGNSNQVNTVRLLLDLNAFILRNKEGHTFFTYAIKTENREVALAAVEHERWEEVMQEFYKYKGTFMVPTLLLIQHLPDIWVLALNKCVTTAECNPKAREYWIKYQFKYLQPNIDHREEIKSRLKNALKSGDNENAARPHGEPVKQSNLDKAFTLPALNRMVTYNRVECLRHPVSTAYLQMKWNAYGRWFHGLNLFIYMLGLIPLTYLVCTTSTSPQYHNDPNWISNSTQNLQAPIQFDTAQKVMMFMITALSIGQILKELMQIYQQRVKYFKDMTNLVEWVLYVCSLLYVTPFFSGYPIHLQFEFGAVAILLAWFNLLLFLQRFDIAGIYVVMFLEILRTLVRVLLVFSFLIVAFALAFYVLMQGEGDQQWSNPGFSIMKVVTMTLGEIGYADYFLAPYVDNDPNTLHFPLTSMILLAAFILVMPILLMNLLIGLAVGDIAQVQTNAALQRLAMQVGGVPI